MSAEPADTAGAAISVRGLRVDFEDRAAVLDGIDLDLPAGGYTLIAGPTGSGKSTLALALIGAIEAATSAILTGEVLVHGREISSVAERERSRLVAAVWQRPEVQLFRSSVIDEVRAGLDHRLVPAAEGDERARSVLRLVGLDGIDERRDPATLSGGEQQRLALAAALVLDTPVLVLDEATSALDRVAARRFGEALDRARSSRELTVVAIDHRPDAHLDRADRLIVLEAGRVALDGPPGEIYAGRTEEARRLGLRLPHEDRRAPSASPVHAPGYAAPGATALRLERIGLTVRGARLLDGIELSLPHGSVAVLTGDNGAGKSTLLRMLACELRPNSGRIRPGRRARIRAGIGAVPQRAADLMLTRSVLDEVCSALAHGAAGRDPATRMRAERLIAAAGLAGLESSHPLRLSGGQRQRLALALALGDDASGEEIGSSGGHRGAPATGGPRLAILDEPTSAQDRAGAELVLSLVAAGRGSRATLIATHEPEVFAAIATHRVELNGGRIAGITRVTGVEA